MCQSDVKELIEQRIEISKKLMNILPSQGGEMRMYSSNILLASVAVDEFMLRMIQRNRGGDGWGPTDIR